MIISVGCRVKSRQGTKFRMGNATLEGLLGYTTPICNNIDHLYNSDTGELRASFNASCQSVGNTSRPSFIRYVQDNHPSLKVFILDMGTDFAHCPSDPSGQVVMIPINNPNAFADAFSEAFISLNPRTATPEFVCQRVRDRLYSNAVSY